jgi:hypothetical protein
MTSRQQRVVRCGAHRWMALLGRCALVAWLERVGMPRSARDKQPGRRRQGSARGDCSGWAPCVRSTCPWGGRQATQESGNQAHTNRTGKQGVWVFVTNNEPATHGGT